MKNMFYSNKKKLKFTAVLLSLAFITSSISGCGEKNMTEESGDIQLKPIADHLYETVISSDYDWGNEVSAVGGTFSCSGIQMGRYRGRNYDWYYDDTDLCVVHTTVTENRPHASVGVADMSFIKGEDGDIQKGKIPFATVDGINDAGVCIQVNVMPYNENGELSHTQSTDDDLNGAHVVRLILDFAGSVEEAVELLEQRDIYSAFGTQEELHWMISGPAGREDSSMKTVILEVFPDGLHITDKFVNDIPVMTNFNVSNFDGSCESVGWGLGYERWQILCENASQANSVMGTFDLMEKVFFSKMYDLYSDQFWYSEYALVNLSDYYSEEELKSIIGEDVYNAYMEAAGGVYYLPALWDGEASIGGDISKTGIIAPAVKKVSDKYNDQNFGTDLWITLETSVYDLENLTLDLSVRESQDHYHFTI